MRTLHGDALRYGPVAAGTHAAIGVYARQIHAGFDDCAATGGEGFTGSQQVFESFA